MLATVYRELGDSENERATLQHLAELDDDSSDVYLRLMELWSNEGNWERTVENAERMLAVNPLQHAPYRYLASACEQIGDDVRAIQALETLVILEPADPADTHYRLAKLHHRRGDLEAARRQILKSLEEAPRFREAHRELLAIIREIGENKNED
jgi:tetratricopeptide (TPR) repeat protein